MFRFICRAGAAVLWPAIAAATSHVPAPAPARPDPLDAAAAVPRLEYRSPLAAYRVPAETTVGRWRDANLRVERAGGWRAYAREAASPPAPAASAGAAR